MNTKMIAAIAVVLIVIVAGAAYAFTVLGDDDSEKENYNVALSIMGNANEDNTLNDADKDIIQSIIDGENTLSRYPLADANDDGVVDEKDLAILDKLIKGEETEAVVIDQDDNKVRVNYPLKNLVTVNSEMLPILIYIGAENKVAGYISANYAAQQSIMDNDFSQKLDGSRAITAASYLSITELDSSLSSEGGIGAILCLNDTALGDYASQFNTAGIPIIKIHCSTPVDSIDAALTLGYLIGGEAKEKAYKYMQDAYDVLNRINDALESVESRQTCIALSMGTYVAEINSGYSLTAGMAGGNIICGLEGDSSQRLNTAEAITNWDGVQHIISFRSLDLVKDNEVGTWDRYYEDLQNSSSYENLVYINASLPIVVKVAYLAELMYPSLFEGLGDETFRHFIDTYSSYLNEGFDDKQMDPEDITVLVTYESYKAQGGTN